jgi:hypothetical protein
MNVSAMPPLARRVQRHGGLVWIHPVGTGGDDQAGRSPARKIIDLAICATVQPTAAAASSAVRVPPGKVSMFPHAPAASSASRTRATEPSVSLPDIPYISVKDSLALYIHTAALFHGLSSSSATRSLTAPE